MLLAALSHSSLVGRGIAQLDRRLIRTGGGQPYPNDLTSRIRSTAYDPSRAEADMRDDFSPSIKRTLAERAGYVCSNPECRRPQLGPSRGDSSKAVNLGNAAHIRAASPGGARYDASQDSTQRSSLANAIYLCSGCADLVDKNGGVGYAVETLTEWKTTHETWIEDRINRGDLDTTSFSVVIWQETSSAVGTVGHAQTVNITQSGITYSDARQIALDVYKANAMTLAEEAAVTARNRAEELTDDFFATLQQRNAEAVKSLESPGMQHALFTAQKEYARTGDKDLEALLVDMLVDRAGAAARDIKQIVLDEAIMVASKLTVERLDALTLVFLLTRTRNGTICSLPTFAAYLDSHITPFVDGLTVAPSCYEHLEYTKCGSLMHFGNHNPIQEFWRQHYQGVFAKGFTAEEWSKRFPNRDDLKQWIVMPCLHDPAKCQINALNEGHLKEECDKRSIESKDVTLLLMMLRLNEMSACEIREYVISVRPSLKKLFDAWEQSQLSQLSVTTVGIAVAHANFRRRTAIQLDLSIWVK
jgi:hypothetical protein